MTRDQRYNASKKGKRRTRRAESTEYRKGYRAGYKAGKRAQDSGMGRLDAMRERLERENAELRYKQRGGGC